MSAVKSKLVNEINRLLILTSSWQSIHKKAECALQLFFDNIVRMIRYSKNSSFSYLIEKKFELSDGFLELSLNDKPLVNKNALGVERYFQELQGYERQLESLFLDMISIAEEGKLSIQSEGNIQKEPFCHCSPTDLLENIMNIIEMHRNELHMKAKILSDLHFDMNTNILSTYLIIWSLQPYLDQNRLEGIKRLVDMEKLFSGISY